MTKFEVNGEVYGDELQMAEAMNKSFQGFTEESVFDKPPSSRIRHPCLNNIEFTLSDVVNEVVNLHVRKSQGPNGVSNWVLKECSKQLAGKIHKIIESSLIESVVLVDKKKADIVPIYESGRHDDPLNY